MTDSADFPPPSRFGSELISVEKYLQGRDVKFPGYLTTGVQQSVTVFLYRLNGFLSELGISPETLIVNSGWRPPPLNEQVGGAPNSYHARGRAIDLYDTEAGDLALKVAGRPDLLLKWGLWLESPSHTPGWVHLDNGDRPNRPSRVFLP